jgi:Na+-transporting NADH:ubiquinone oxidoreductase subunit NqrC
MNLVTVDRDMIISELYVILSLMSEDNSEENIKKQVLLIADIMQKAPVNENKSNYPKINVRHG